DRLMDRPPRGEYNSRLDVTFVSHLSGTEPRSISAIAATVVHEGGHDLQPNLRLVTQLLDRTVPESERPLVSAQLQFEREYQGFQLQQRFLQGLAGFRSDDLLNDQRLPKTDD